MKDRYEIVIKTDGKKKLYYIVDNLINRYVGNGFRRKRVAETICDKLNNYVNVYK